MIPLGDKSGSPNDWVRHEIQNALHRGIRVSIHGESYVQEEKDLSLVAEDGCYMTDYISDDTGKIVQINFEQIE